MQIQPPSTILVSSLAASASAPDKGGRADRNSSTEIAAPVVAATPGDAERNDAATVSLSAEVRTRELGDTPAPVYAEIWKGSIKVAQVDIYGQVVSYSGLLAGGGGGVAGPLLAAQRAIQLAQQTGGEIRTAGQVLDNQTLLMRAKLARAYTA